MRSVPTNDCASLRTEIKVEKNQKKSLHVTLFNNKDTIVAGTNLQKANDFRSSPDSGENTATPVEPKPVVAKVTVENRADSFGMHDQSAHNGFYQGSARADSGFN